MLSAVTDCLGLYPNRKESEEDQLMAAQAYLKLGEVSAESGKLPINRKECLFCACGGPRGRVCTERPLDEGRFEVFCSRRQSCSI